jgi:hypothetical protein
MHDRGSILVRRGDFSLRHRIQIGYGTHPAYLIGTGGEMAGV